MQVISTRVHGVLDYAVGLLLIVSPWLLDFDGTGAAQWVPVILGLGAIGYALLTDYELGVLRTIPMPAHLGLDMASGLLLAVSPWLFGFADIIAWPHVVIGLGEIAIAAMTERRPGAAAADAGRFSPASGGGTHRERIAPRADPIVRDTDERR